MVLVDQKASSLAAKDEKESTLMPYKAHSRDRSQISNILICSTQSVGKMTLSNYQ